MKITEKSNQEKAEKSEGALQQTFISVLTLAFPIGNSSQRLIHALDCANADLKLGQWRIILSKEAHIQKTKKLRVCFATKMQTGRFFVSVSLKGRCKCFPLRGGERGITFQTLK